MGRISRENEKHWEGEKMSKPAGPCHKCEEREVGCHSHCIAYRKWHAEHIAEKKKENEKRYAYYTAGMTRRTVDEIMRRKGER